MMCNNVGLLVAYPDTRKASELLQEYRTAIQR